MNLPNIGRRLVPVVLIAGSVFVVGLAGCGANGPLMQPPPLFGQRARQDYDAQQAASARRVEERNAAARNSNAIADQEANTVENDQPKSTRSIPDPNQVLTTPRNSPVPGAPDPLGPTVSLTPPN